MSGKRNKRKRKSIDEKTTTELLNQPEVPKDEMYEYLYSLFKRYAGYTCVSVSKPGSVSQEGEDKNVVPIKMHKYVPALQDNGEYKSPQDKLVEYVKITNDDFEGVIVDRAKRIVIGDLFSHQPPPPLDKEQEIKTEAEII